MTSDEIKNHTVDVDDVKLYIDAQTRLLAGIFKMSREVAFHVAQINERFASSKETD